MRELVLRIDRDRGGDPVSELLADYPETRTKSISINATRDWCWSCEYATGVPAGIDELALLLESDGEWRQHLLPERSVTEHRTDVLDRGSSHLVCANMWKRPPAPASVPGLAYDHFGPGLLMETRSQEGVTRWHFAFREAADTSRFVSELETLLSRWGSVTMDRLSEPDGQLSGEPLPHEELPLEQESVLEEAVRRGYYEIPRQLSLDELAEQLGIAQSTASYRLRRAEAFLARKFIESAPPFSSIPASVAARSKQRFDQLLQES